MTYIVGLEVPVGVLHPVVHHHHRDASASDVALPHSRYVDVHSLVEVIVLRGQET